MPDDLESKTAIALVASLMRQLQKKNIFGDRDIATIFGHADDSMPGKQNPEVDAILVRAQEIVAE